MLAAFLDGQDILLIAICAITVILALGFFVSIYLADAKEARRRAEAKKAFRRAQKHFAPDPNSKRNPISESQPRGSGGGD